MRIAIDYNPIRRVVKDKFTTMDCPFAEEDTDKNEMWCFLKPTVENGKCVGCMQDGCPITEVQED